MAGIGDGYVGTAQDAVRIRRLEKQSQGQSGLLQIGSSTSEVRKGDAIGEFLRAFQQQLAPELREVGTILRWRICSTLKKISLFLIFSTLMYMRMFVQLLMQQLRKMRITKEGWTSVKLWLVLRPGASTILSTIKWYV